jgi:hypothetical protein
VYCEQTAAETTVLSIASGGAALYRAKLPGRGPERADPYRSFPILQERLDTLSGKVGVLSYPAIFPTGKPVVGANPKTAITPGDQFSNPAVREILTRRRLPRNTPHSIETKQAKFRAQPEITVGRLGNRGDTASEKAFADRPIVVSVLIDVERGI